LIQQTNWRHALSSLIFGIILLGATLSRSNEATGEWPQWRGPNRDGVSLETGLLKEWPSTGPPLVWKTQGLGNGYSTVAVSRGRLYTMGVRDNQEFILAIDVTDGKTLWVQAHGSRFTNDKGDGPRSTPTVDGNFLYALGGNGDLSCLELNDGKTVWTMNILQKFESSNIHWGISESPLIVGDRLLVTPGGKNASIVALNKKDGSIIWKSQSDRPGYSSGVYTELGGVPEAIFFTESRAVGVDVRDGSLLWEYSQASNRTANCATPIVSGNYVFLSSDYGTGCALLALVPNDGKINAREIYFNQEMKNHHSSSVLVDGTLYGFSSTILTAMRFNDGHVFWKDRSVGKGSLTYADGRLYCLSEKGIVGLVEASPEAYKEKGRFSIPQESLPTWSHPVVAGGRLYLRDQDVLYAYDIREKL
jgi:outer membrane protein assembly factor BamB